jgi:hypothetical protein
MLSYGIGLPDCRDEAQFAGIDDCHPAEDTGAHSKGPGRQNRGLTCGFIGVRGGLAR